MLIILGMGKKFLAFFLETRSYWLHGWEQVILGGTVSISYLMKTDKIKKEGWWELWFKQFRI